MKGGAISWDGKLHGGEIGGMQEKTRSWKGLLDIRQAFGGGGRNRRTNHSCGFWPWGPWKTSIEGRGRGNKEGGIE